MYSEKQKTLDYEDDIISILKCIWCCYKANGFTSNLLNDLLRLWGLFTEHNCSASCSFDYFILEFEFKSRLPIPEFSGYHCIWT